MCTHCRINIFVLQTMHTSWFSGKVLDFKNGLLPHYVHVSDFAGFTKHIHQAIKIGVCSMAVLLSLKGKRIFWFKSW